MAEKITDAIAFMIAKDNEPLNLTEKPGFKNLMRVLASNYKLPCRKTMTFRLEKKYELMKKLVKLKLSQVTSLALTCDIWTEQYNTTSFLGVTVHYLSVDDNEIRSITLGY